MRGRGLWAEAARPWLSTKCPSSFGGWPTRLPNDTFTLPSLSRPHISPDFPSLTQASRLAYKGLDCDLWRPLRVALGQLQFARAMTGSPIPSRPKYCPPRFALTSLESLPFTAQLSIIPFHIALPAPPSPNSTTCLAWVDFFEAHRGGTQKVCKSHRFAGLMTVLDLSHAFFGMTSVIVVLWFVCGEFEGRLADQGGPL